jgi:hypothetical protein
VLGRMVSEWHSAEVDAGVHETAWDLNSARGQRVANGVYFMHIRVDGHEYVRRLVIAR